MQGLLEALSSRDVSESLLRERRSAPAVRTLARICGIQPKDVPILVLAFDHRDRRPTILTNDESFADFQPADHSLRVEPRAGPFRSQAGGVRTQCFRLGSGSGL